jgi:hypothetical protein
MKVDSDGYISMAAARVVDPDTGTAYAAIWYTGVGGCVLAQERADGSMRPIIAMPLGLEPRGYDMCVRDGSLYVTTAGMVLRLPLQWPPGRRPTEWRLSAGI